MDYPEYLSKVSRTESIPAIELVWSNEAGDLDEAYNRVMIRLLHSALGIVTEVDEFETSDSLTNAAEELGDITWYLAVADLAIQDYGGLSGTLAAVAPSQSGEQDQLVSLHSLAANLADLVKRAVFYGREMDWDTLRWILAKTWKAVEILAGRRGLLMAEVFQANITKLAKRYPDLAFNAEHALTRNVEHELSHLPALVAQATDQAVEVIHAEPSDADELMDFPRFRARFMLLLPHKLHAFVGEPYVQLAEYFGRNGSLALCEGFKAGYIRATTSPSATDAWAAWGIWNTIAKQRLTPALVEGLMTNPKSICLCKLSV